MIQTRYLRVWPRLASFDRSRRQKKENKGGDVSRPNGHSRGQLPRQPPHPPPASSPPRSSRSSCSSRSAPSEPFHSLGLQFFLSLLSRGQGCGPYPYRRSSPRLSSPSSSRWRRRSSSAPYRRRRSCLRRRRSFSPRPLLQTLSHPSSSVMPVPTRRCPQAAARPEAAAAAVMLSPDAATTRASMTLDLEEARCSRCVSSLFHPYYFSRTCRRPSGRDSR